MTNAKTGQAILSILQLKRGNACDDQVGLFQELWGERVDVEEEEFLKHATKFDWAWGADVLLLQQGGRERSTGQSWYSAWRDRSNEYAQPAFDAYRALRQERRDKSAEADRKGKYDEVFDSYDESLNAAHAAYRKALPEGQAIWFARLYREACGITTDEWQLKEKEDGAKESTDDADPSAAESPVTLEPLAVVDGEVAAAESADYSSDSFSAVPAGEPAEPTEGSGREV